MFDIGKFDTPIGGEIPEESIFRVKRNGLLYEADIMINKALDSGEDVSGLRAYRQALRDSTVDLVIPDISNYYPTVKV